MTLPDLPDADLDVGRPLSARFAAQGAWRYRDAARLVWDLPYGRPRHAGLDAVLRERRGTGRTKHALLAALAAEAGLAVDLHVGLYLMTEANTPGVGRVLRAQGLDAIPAIRFVLGVGEERIDLAWPDVQRPVPPFLAEETIRPDQIDATTRDWHRQHLDAWARAQGRDPATVWSAHEAAAAALVRAGR